VTGFSDAGRAWPTVWYGALAACLGVGAVLAFWFSELMSLGLFGVPADRGASPVVPIGSSLFALLPLIAVVALPSNVYRGVLVASGLLAFVVASIYCAVVMSSTQVQWPAFLGQLALVSLTIALAGTARFLWDRGGRRRRWAVGVAAASAASILCLGALVQMPLWAFVAIAAAGTVIVVGMVATSARATAGPPA
jgi:hypothetical protein